MKLADALSYFVLKAKSTKVKLPPLIRSGCSMSDLEAQAARQP